MIALIIQYRRLIIGGIILLSLLGLWYHGYAKGKSVERGKCEIGKVKAINENIVIRKEQDSVVSISGTALADSLRRGTF